MSELETLAPPIAKAPPEPVPEEHPPWRHPPFSPWRRFWKSTARVTLLLGADLVAFTALRAAIRAIRVRRERDLGLVFVHPFDDPLIAAGQGTIAAEILEDLPNTGTVIIPLSGGGLVGGIAYGLATIDGSVDAIAVSARNARVMFESLRVGRSLEMEEEETLASALSGGIGPDNRYTMALVAEHVREHLLVSEAEIAGAMRFAAERLKLVVEGGGAVGIAALLAGKLPIGGRSAGGTASRPLVVVVSGGNVAVATLAGL